MTAAVSAARHGARIGRSTLDRLHEDAPTWDGAWPVGATDDLVALLLEGHRAVPVLEDDTNALQVANRGPGIVDVVQGAGAPVDHQGIVVCQVTLIVDRASLP